jgi:hypothetical protein
VIQVRAQINAQEILFALGERARSTAPGAAADYAARVAVEVLSKGRPILRFVPETQPGRANRLALVFDDTDREHPWPEREAVVHLTLAPADDGPSEQGEFTLARDVESSPARLEDALRAELNNFLSKPGQSAEASRLFSVVPFEGVTVKWTGTTVTTGLERRHLSQGSLRDHAVFAVFVEQLGNMLSFRSCNPNAVAGPLTRDPATSCEALLAAPALWPAQVAPSATWSRLYLTHWIEK